MANENNLPEPITRKEIYLNAIAQKGGGGGGGGAGLPAVTSEDNGDVLTVVEGTWAKAAPSGGDTFEIVFTATYDGDEPTYTCNKTIAEISAEYSEHGFSRMAAKLLDSSSVLFPLSFSIFTDDITANLTLALNFVYGNEFAGDTLGVAIMFYSEAGIQVNELAFVLTPAEE